jgi:hypothetical protein
MHASLDVLRDAPKLMAFMNTSDRDQCSRFGMFLEWRFRF